MKKICFLFLLSISTILFGQQTKLIKDKLNNEEYFVLKKNTTIKNGEYSKYGFNNNLIVKGYFKNGERDSIWEFYNTNGEIIQKFDYTKKELTYLKINDSEKDKIYKLINGSDNPSVVLQRPPVFLGGDDYFTEELVKNIQYPEDAYKNGISGKVYVSFIVDKDGKIGNFNIIKSLGHGLDEEAIRVLKLIPNNWLPGLLDGQPVAIELNYPVTFRIF